MAASRRYQALQDTHDALARETGRTFYARALRAQLRDTTFSSTALLTKLYVPPKKPTRYNEATTSRLEEDIGRGKKVRLQIAETTAGKKGPKAGKAADGGTGSLLAVVNGFVSRDCGRTLQKPSDFGCGFRRKFDEPGWA